MTDQDKSTRALDHLYNPSISDLELDEQHGKDRPVVYLDQAEAAIDAAVKEARINEVHNFGNWNADKGYVDLFDAIDSRLKQLNQPQEKK